MNSYRIVDNPELQVITKRYVKLPHHHLVSNTPRGLNILGINHITQYFNVRADGSAELTFDNEYLNDTFSVTIHFALISYQIELKRNHPFYHYVKDGNATCRDHNIQSFSITVGDLFKLFYKQNTSFFDRKQNTKKKTKRGYNIDDEGDENEEAIKKREQEEEEEEDRARVAKLTMKAWKINSTSLAPDPRDILGALGAWKENRFRLWNLLTKEGHIKKPRSDFTSFCSTLVVLPMFSHNPREKFETEFPKIATYELLKKVTRYYLFTEDPEVKVYPERDFFADPKSLVDICELYSEQIVPATLIQIKTALTRPANHGEQNMLESKFPNELIFDNIGNVEDTYPVFALRKIRLESWCTREDIDSLQYLVEKAVLISMSDKAKTFIKKRGKFQKYSAYANRSWHGWRDYKVKERHHFDKLVQEDFFVAKKKNSSVEEL